jgi:hypothetical protein
VRWQGDGNAKKLEDRTHAESDSQPRIYALVPTVQDRRPEQFQFLPILRAGADPSARDADCATATATTAATGREHTTRRTADPREGPLGQPATGELAVA